MNLTTRLLWLLSSLVLLATLLFAWGLGAPMLEDRYRHLRISAGNLTAIMADVSRHALQKRDVAELRHYLVLADAFPELAYIAAYDEANHLLTWHGQVAPPGLREPLQGNEPTLWETLFNGTEHLELEYPIVALPGENNKRPLGYIRTRVTLGSLRQYGLTLCVTAVALGIVLSIPSLLLGWRLALRISQPLQKLAQAVLAITRSNTEIPIITTAIPELQQLAESLESLAAWLNKHERYHQTAKADLEAEVRKRTEALRRLINHTHQLAEKAQAANEAKSRFLANVSHELRTPLNAILGFMELLASMDLSAQQRHYVRLTIEAAQSLLQLIEDLLDFSRIEAGQVELRTDCFELSRMMETVTMLHRQLADSKGLYLKVHVPPGLAQWWYGDEGRLRQVLGNLVHNALKFTERGGVTITVTEPKSGHLCFEVRDTGIGLAPEDRDRIFEAFTQLDDNASRRYGGAGLGLSICRQLVRAMGGHIEVESEPGRGSLFRVELPLQRASTPEAVPGKLATTACGQLKGRVLLVEDNRLNRTLLSEMLRHLGCQVDAVAEASEAILRWRQTRYDLVLLDCQLPETDGYQIARYFRDHPQGEKVPIVAVTADVSAGIQERCRAVGMDACLHKPITPDRLRACLASWLAESSIQSQVPPSRSAKPLISVFNSATLEQIRMLDRANQGRLLERLLQLFRDQGRQWLTVLEQGMTTGDVTSIQRAAHSFLSSCIHLGIEDLADYLTRLEKEPQNFDVRQMAFLWAGYRRACCLLGAAKDGC